MREVGGAAALAGGAPWRRIVWEAGDHGALRRAARRKSEVGEKEERGAREGGSLERAAAAAGGVSGERRRGRGGGCPREEIEATGLLGPVRPSGGDVGPARHRSCSGWRWED